MRKNIAVAASYSSVQEGIKGILQIQPQLVFLDVQIGDKTGFDLLQSIKEISFEVIFLPLLTINMPYRQSSAARSIIF